MAMIGAVCALLLALVVLIVCVRSASSPPKQQPPSAEPSMTDRLKAANAVCYGADWCGFTRKQLAETQDVRDAYSYVDCGEEKERCKSDGITAYPTWMINGKKHEGFMTSQRLGSIC